MTIHDFIAKYGINMAPLLLENYAMKNIGTAGGRLARDMAVDLRAALEDYASQDVEPPTVGGEVI